MNMHQAAFTTCRPNIANILDEKINLKLWTCLYKCIELDNSWKNISDWHRADELMADLLKQIAFEGNIRRSTVLFYFASKFGSLQYKTNVVIDEFTDFLRSEKTLRSLTNDTSMTPNYDWDILRNECQKHDSYIIYKWIKKMLLLIGNQNLFYGDAFEVGFNLHVSELLTI